MYINESFFNRHSLEVAHDLIGKKLTFGSMQGIISETEAYRGSDDSASHAFKGRTKRSQTMFEPPGTIYVYMIYGMYFCLNIVCEPKNIPGAVLIRGLFTESEHLDGPGKICRSFNINTQQNGLNILSAQSFDIDKGIHVEKRHITHTPRIGIKKAKDKLWRCIWQPNQNELAKIIAQLKEINP